MTDVAGVVVTPRGHDVVVGIAVEERVPVSAVTMRIAEHAIARMVRGLVPEDVLLGDATEVWVSCDRIERWAASAKTLLAARVDEAGDWKRSGRVRRRITSRSWVGRPRSRRDDRWRRR